MGISKNGDRRFTIMTTNCLESFIDVLKRPRALPIQAVIARTFFCLLNFFHIVEKRQRYRNHVWHQRMRTSWDIDSILLELIIFKDLVWLSRRYQIGKDIHAPLTSRNTGALVLVNYLSSTSHLVYIMLWHVPIIMVEC